MHKFGINLYGVFVGKSKTAYFWSLILFRACLVAIFNKNGVFNLRREKHPCISVSHNHYLSLSLFFPLSPSLRYKTQKFLQKKKKFKKIHKIPICKTHKATQHTKFENGRRRQHARGREREREHDFKN